MRETSRYNRLIVHLLALSALSWLAAKVIGGRVFRAGSCACLPPLLTNRDDSLLLTLSFRLRCTAFGEEDQPFFSDFRLKQPSKFVAETTANEDGTIPCKREKHACVNVVSIDSAVDSS